MVPIGLGGAAPVSRVSLLFVCLGFCLPHRFRSFLPLLLHVYLSLRHACPRPRLPCWVLDFCVLSRLESREEEEERRRIRRRRIRKGQQSWNLRISKLFQMRTSTACPPWSTNFKSVTGLSFSFAASFIRVSSCYPYPLPVFFLPVLRVIPVFNQDWNTVATVRRCGRQ